MFKITDTEDKVKVLSEGRNIDLVQVKNILDKGGWITIREGTRENQKLFIFEMDGYCYVAAVVITDYTIKTVWPSRKMTKLYLKD